MVRDSPLLQPLTAVMWVCLKIGYIPNEIAIFLGIMISKTIGFRGTLFSDTPIYEDD